MTKRKKRAGAGKLYFHKQKRQKRIRKQIRWLVVGTGILLLLFFLLKPNFEKHAEGQQNAGQQVYASELAGYLQIANLTPEETRRLLLPQLQEILTTEDVQVMFDLLGFSDYTAEVTGQAVLKEGAVLTRKQWDIVYEILLEKLQMKDAVSQVSIQFLGKIAGTERVMADNGNYDCDLESCRMEYGKRYLVYVQGNLILGIASGQETEGKGAEKRSGDMADNQEAVTAEQMVLPDTIRVLLTQDQNQNIYRSDVWLKSDGEWKLSDGSTEEAVPAGEGRSCKNWMELHQTDHVVAEAAGEGKLILTDENGTEKGRYAGKIHSYRSQSDLWVVNELGMEAYLYGVVPGEMPSSFVPEALKAQAVCARTYAAKQALETAYEAYHADVDDTTACQVYLPASENQATTDAVNETAGKVLLYENRLAQVYYFSTSCGYTTGLEVWQQEQVPYLATVNLLTEQQQETSVDEFLKNQSVQAYDSESRFFRWKGELSLAERSDSLKKALQDAHGIQDGKMLVSDEAGNAVTDISGFGRCKKAEVCARAASGAVTDLLFSFEHGQVHVYNENLMRTLVWQICTSLTDKNGDRVNTIRMLPSAFFTLQEVGDAHYEICGGGLGHGIGMSQYGADGMARAGKNATEILQTFFPGTEVSNGRGL